MRSVEGSSLVPRGRIIAVAYGADPGAGSEAGAGWIWARLLATFGETWVLTRTRNEQARAHRDSEIRALGLQDRLHFVDVELPRWTRIWRRDSSVAAHRLQRLEYLVWQAVAAHRARELQAEIGFDLAWHLTWANVWGGSAVDSLRLPFIFGPVGGAVQPPWRLVGDLGARGAWFEIIRAIGQMIARHVSILPRRAWSRASLILVQNRETRDWLPSFLRSRIVVFPNAVLEASISPTNRGAGPAPRALYAGRLLPLKGVSLAIRTIAQLPEWRLLVCGDGPDAPRLRALARSLHVADRVDFLGWQDRTEVLRLMSEEASVFLFPSFHDEGSWVTAEARAAGLPVVCLDRGGPPALGGIGVRATSRKATVRRLVEAVEAARNSRPAPTNEFSFEAVQARLAAILERHGLLDVMSPSADS